MGLDTVELVMDVEEQFDIKIPDWDYELLATVGDLHNYICAQTEVKKSQHCLSSAAFLRLRRGLMSAVGIERERVRLETPIANLLPTPGRRRNWQHLQDEMKVRLPKLRRPEWLSISLLRGAFVVIPVSFLVSVATLFNPLVPQLWWLFPLSIIATVLAYQLTLPWATCISPDCATIRTMTTTVLQQNLYRFVQWENLPFESSEQVFVRLADIVSEHLGTPLKDIRPDSRFIEDLGAG